MPFPPTTATLSIGISYQVEYKIEFPMWHFVMGCFILRWWTTIKDKARSPCQRPCTFGGIFVMHNKEEGCLTRKKGVCYVYDVAVSIVIQLFVAFNPICFVLARTLTHFAFTIQMEGTLSDNNIKCLLKTRIISICVNFRLLFICNESIERISFRFQIAFGDKLLTFRSQTTISNQRWKNLSTLLCIWSKIIICDTNYPADLRTNLLQSSVNVKCNLFSVQWIYLYPNWTCMHK